MAKKNAAVLPAKKRKVKTPAEDKILYTVVNIVMVFWLLIVLLPVIFIVASSLSESSAIATGKVLLLPQVFRDGTSTFGLSFAAYKAVFNYKLIWSSFANTVFYTVCGTCLNLIATTLVAYPLSRKGYQARGFITALFIITMFIQGGMIPAYLNIRDLGLLDKRIVMMLPGLIGTQNMIIMRTFFSNSIPADLQEAASLDGCSDIRYLLQIVLPLSKAVMSVLLLYYAVGHWNAYYSAMLYLRSTSKFPLQLVLRTVLISAEEQEVNIGGTQAAKEQAGEAMKYALIVVTTVPILLVYPFIQKYFEQGVMIGSLKG